MINKTEWRYEKEWLEKVRKVIEWQLEVGKEQSQKFREAVRTTNKLMWQDTPLATGDFEEDFDMIVVLNQYMRERKVKTLTYEFYRRMVLRLKKLAQTPYFGRIDFQEAGEAEIEPIYIGLATLFNQEEECLIYDWRAPISSMFYEYQPGQSSYECNSGIVEGEMALKRQYKIANGEIQYMFDTNLKIDDEILQSILGQHSSGKMKQIVTTIQREQNQVIRDEEHKLLIVQGAAGSGKTSIALHRIAYLLYTYRNSLKSDQILIFSPNYIFSDYISNVLPELGEENMRQITFHEYAEMELGDELEIEDVHQQLEYFLSHAKDLKGYQNRERNILYKTSTAFVRVIKNYISLLEEKGVPLDDIGCFGQVILSKEELFKLWQKNSYLPFNKRLNKIQGRIGFLLRQFKKKKIRELHKDVQIVPGEPLLEGTRRCITAVRNEIIPLKKRAIEMLSFDLMDLYLQLFKDPTLFGKITEGTEIPDDIEQICEQTLERFAARTVDYTDVIPLLYFKAALTGESFLKNSIKYVVIDEAQDYSAFHYELIRLLFPESHLTLLGDLNQSIHPYLEIGQYQRIVDIFQTESSQMVYLKNSYRSTTEIANFAKGILSGDPEIQTVQRPGERPRLIQLAKQDQVQGAILEGIHTCKKNGAESIAVICKTAVVSEQIFKLLKDKLKIDLVTQETYELNRELVVIPSYLAKGLEFDAVLVYMDDAANYCGEDETHLFYTVCTRALHDLYLYNVGQLSPFIEAMDETLYEVKNF